MTTQPLVVWTEVPVGNVAKAAAFYDAVLGTATTIDTSSPRPMANINNAMDSVGCTLFEGAPAPGTVLHFAVDSLEAAAERAKQAGGKVIGDPVEIPAGRFVYATDPDGNKLGLFEPKR